MVVSPVIPIGNEMVGVEPIKTVGLAQPAQTPFSQFLDSAVDALTDLSKLEENTKVLTYDYMQGNATLEEVMIQTNKLSLAMQLAVSVITTGAQTFKELQQLQV
ncbi:MAG: flagellar hook-basal body complex protein FliE [Candidatus Margulisiibacteriota bacterium]